MDFFLKTQRLCLRNLREGDEEALWTYRNDEKCYVYQRWEDTSREAIRSQIDAHCRDVFLSDKEEQHFAISTPEGEPVGDLSCFYTPSDRCVTLGITLAPEHHRKGYAFEILSAVVAAVQLRLPRLDIVALIDRENAASIALFEKLGFYRECYAEKLASYVYVIDGKKSADWGNNSGI